MHNRYEYFSKPIKVTAHRGDSKYYPENSKVAFNSAVELGVDVIETDVHISSDGIIFIWHDENTKKLDGDERSISTRPWSELKELDLGFLYIDKNGKRPFASQGIRLMTFSEALHAFPNTRFNVDLKDNNINLVQGMYRILEQDSAFDRVVVASFSSENLKAIRKFSDRVATSYGQSEVLLRVILSKLNLFRFVSNFLPRYPVIQVPVSSGGITVVTKRFIKILHKRGVKIQVWTINEKEEMKKLYKMGVDGVMTDDPRLLLEVVNQLKKEVK